MRQQLENLIAAGLLGYGMGALAMEFLGPSLTLFIFSLMIIIHAGSHLKHEIKK